MWVAQIVLFWIAAGYIGDQLKNQVNELQSTSFIVMTIFSTSLFLVILKPLATIATGLLKNRKIWIQISSCMMIILAIILSITNLPLWLLIIATLMLSFSLASSTLFYLFLNEQSFYRIYILPTVWITFVFMTFSTVFGIYLSNLNTFVSNNSITANVILTVLMVTMIIVGIVLSLFSKENKNMIQVFDSEILESLPKKNKTVFFVLYLLGFLLCLTSAMNNSLVIKMYIALNLNEFNLNKNSIELWLRINNFAYLLPTIIASVVSYKLLRKVFEQKYLIFINLFVLFAVYTSMAFIQNPFVFICLNIFAGICFNQVIYSLFSVCLFWNYRAKNNPVTGYFGSAMVFSYLIVDITQNAMISSRTGVFKYFTNIDDILKRESNELKSALNLFDNVSTIMMSIACVIILITIIIFYFMSNKLMADYAKYRVATQNLKVLIKKRVIAKTKTKINVEVAIDEGVNEYE
ncbi:hypothetical protein [Spiroplasma monobiae]|nr:hypothetical protein [Spiroplasma monobiae]